MVTDRYLDVFYHPDVADFLAAVEGSSVVAVDNLPGALPLAKIELPERCVLVFGSEQNGLSDEIRTAAASMVFIEQQGSTRSLNAGAAAAIAMYQWQLQHILR